MTALFISLYYLYCLSIFQRTCRFVSKADAKVRGLFLTTKLFRKFFFIFFLFYSFLRLSCERERIIIKEKSKTALFANRTAKIKTFIYMFQTFSELFCFIIKRSYALSLSHLSRLSSLGKRVQKYTLLEYHPNLFNSFF